ncbi:hypothetical protein PV326_001293, partial [Microctonus aethiopoides]
MVWSVPLVPALRIGEAFVTVAEAMTAYAPAEQKLQTEERHEDYLGRIRTTVETADGGSDDSGSVPAVPKNLQGASLPDEPEAPDELPGEEGLANLKDPSEHDITVNSADHNWVHVPRQHPLLLKRCEKRGCYYL